MPTAQASPALERLMEAPNVYDLTPEKDAWFLEAMRAAIAHHRAASPFYAALCAHAGFTELPGLDALHTVPHVFVNVLKRHELLSVPRAEVALHLTSSGTAGQKSQVFFDEGSKARGLYMIDRIGPLRRAVTNRPPEQCRGRTSLLGRIRGNLVAVKACSRRTAIGIGEPGREDGQPAEHMVT